RTGADHGREGRAAEAPLRGAVATAPRRARHRRAGHRAGARRADGDGGRRHDRSLHRRRVQLSHAFRTVQVRSVRLSRQSRAGRSGRMTLRAAWWSFTALTSATLGGLWHLLLMKETLDRPLVLAGGLALAWASAAAARACERRPAPGAPAVLEVPAAP